MTEQDVPSTALSEELQATRSVVLEWFFSDIVRAWDRASTDSGPLEPIVASCALPLLLTSPRGARRIHTADAITQLLQSHFLVLRLADNAHVLVPDCRVTAYSPVAASIEVIWVHHNPDDVEIARLAVHYDVVRLDGTWLVTGVHIIPTDHPSLDSVWSPVPADEID